jgi:hypothetical protein
MTGTSETAQNFEEISRATKRATGRSDGGRTRLTVNVVIDFEA